MIQDQLGRTLEVERPSRIVSLCPSTTETLCALGAGKRLVGRTDYCRHPHEVVTGLASVGGTKRVKPDALERLQPDLVVSVREENDRTQVEDIAARWPTLILDPVDVASAIAGIELLGAAIDARDAARELATSVRTSFADLPNVNGARVVYLIWRKPYMAVGADTYLHDVLERLGFVNVAASTDARYPEVSQDELEALDADLVLASSEPFPFTEKHLPELRELAPRATPVLVDGEMFSWHGVRMLEATRYFRDLIATLPSGS